MTDYLEFCREYWFQILTFLGFICEIVFIFIKRKPKTVDDFLLAMNEVRSLLPELISSVEEPGKGAVKKNKVMAKSTKVLENKLGRKLSSRELQTFSKVVSADIETILETPTKKGNLL